MGKRGAKGHLRPFPGSPRQRCLRRQQQQQRQMQQQQQRQQQQQQQRQQQHRQRRRRRGRRGRPPGQGPGRAAMGLAGLPEKVLAGKSKIYSPRRSKRCSRMRSSIRGDASGVYLSVRCRGRPVTRSYSKPEEKRKSRREPSALKSDKPKRRGPRRGRPARLPKPKSQAAEPPKSRTSSCQPRKAAVTKPGPKKPIKGQQVRRGRCRGKPQQNRKLTDSYPVRRSSRKSKAELQSEERRRIDELIASGKEEGMKIGLIDGKGRGVIATKQFSRGQFIVEYHGDLIEITDAKKREALYAQDPSTGCYMYYFQYLSKTYCIDATRETNRLGRLINHSKRGNCQTKLHDVAGVPHLILIASRDIQAGEELLYDYGDRSRESLEAHPWLKH